MDMGTWKSPWKCNHKFDELKKLFVRVETLFSWKKNNKKNLQILIVFIKKKKKFMVFYIKNPFVESTFCRVDM